MSQIGSQTDQLDVGELLAAIWYNWRIVVCVVVIVVAFASYFAFVIAVPEYKASSRFEILDQQQDAGQLNQVAGLASLAGISLQEAASEADALQDRILSRPFVESIYEKAEFHTDPIFNVLLRTPGTIENIRRKFFGTSERPSFERDDFHVIAVEALRDVLRISPRDNGIIELTVLHPDPDRAAEITNLIVEQALQDIFFRERDEIRESLNYFADELLQVRVDLDAASAAVRDFAINNSMLSAEELERTSFQLAEVRRDIEAIDESIVALGSLQEEDFFGSEFVKKFPVATSSSFRRVLKLSGNPNDWQKPTAAEISRATVSLNAQRASLISSFDALEARAKISGAEALELSALEREVEVRQAIYESLITQFESRSLISGYERASGRIVETAISPNKPVSPKKALILALGTVFGVLLGCAVALVWAFRRATVYTKSGLEKQLGSYLSSARCAAAGGVLEVRRKELKKPQGFPVWGDPEVQCVGVVSTSSSDLSINSAVSLTKGLSTLGGRTAILNLSETTLKPVESGICSESGSFTIAAIEKQVDLIKPSRTGDFMRRAEADCHLSDLRKQYEYVIVVLPSVCKDAVCTRVVSQLVDTMLIVNERSRTTRKSLNVIKSVLSQSEAVNSKVILV